MARLWAGRFDVVHFHDLGDAFSPWTVLAVACLVPTVWTLHDCSPFTGGCLYPMDCGRFTRECGACPRLGEWPLGWLDATALSARLKRFVHASARVKAIAPCAWIADLAVASRRVRERPVIVPYGVNTEMFRPTADRAALRRSLGLPKQRPVFLVSSMRIAEPRKGVAHALRAVAALAELSPVVVAIGAHPKALSMIPRGVEVRFTGYVGDRSELSRCIAASDAFICCSEADNQPLALLEAMACGVPTVRYATGGIPETLGGCGRFGACRRSCRTGCGTARSSGSDCGIEIRPPRANASGREARHGVVRRGPCGGLWECDRTAPPGRPGKRPVKLLFSHHASRLTRGAIYYIRWVFDYWWFGRVGAVCPRQRLKEGVRDAARDRDFASVARVQ
jgi:glycosyltransferase involved in cell wall biosynthesis